MRCFFILLVFIVPIFAKVINFSPLPMDKAPALFAQYSPMLKYLEKETGYQFKLHFSESYDDIIEKFKKGELDLIELGPLPYIRLKEKYNDAHAFLTFLSSKGKDSYTCEILTTDKNIKSLKDINEDVDIKLTRKVSTCGYLMSEIVLRKSGKSLENLNYDYVGTHTNVLLELLIKESTVGTAKSTIADRYTHFNFTKLASSPAIPGFAFIANKKTILDEDIKNIQQALLKLRPLENKNDQNFVSRWSDNVKYGAQITKKDAYKDIFDALKLVKVPQKSSK